MPPQTDIRQLLTAVEPDYDKAAQLGAAILPDLAEIIEKNDPRLITQATYLSGMLVQQSAEALPTVVELLSKSAHSDLPTARVAAAATAKHLPTEHAAPLLLVLIDDDDLSVRKFAMMSAPPDSPPELAQRIEERAQTEQLPEMRELAREVLQRLKR